MDNTNGKKLRERAEEILQSKSEDLQIKKDSEIKELMRTQSELEESRNKYQELYNFAPVGYFSFNRSEFFARIESSISEDTPGPEAVLCKTTVNDITEEVRYREKVESSLKEKEISLKEIHHRVKNNLAMISSLMSLQKSYLHDKETIAIFEQSRQRIQSIGLIHEKLYRSGDLTHIDFADYEGELISSLMDSFTEESDHIAHDIDIEKTDSLGLNLVTLLVQQLEGTIELNREEGAEFNITFSTAS